MLIIVVQFRMQTRGEGVKKIPKFCGRHIWKPPRMYCSQNDNTMQMERLRLDHPWAVTSSLRRNSSSSLFHQLICSLQNGSVVMFCSVKGTTKMIGLYLDCFGDELPFKPSVPGEHEVEEEERRHGPRGTNWSESERQYPSLCMHVG